MLLVIIIIHNGADYDNGHSDDRGMRALGSEFTVRETARQCVGRLASLRVDAADCTDESDIFRVAGGGGHRAAVDRGNAFPQAATSLPAAAIMSGAGGGNGGYIA